MLFIIESQRKRYLKYQAEKEKIKLPKNIYKQGNKYIITKKVNGFSKYFKTLNTLDEAIRYKEKLIANNWEPLPLTEEELYEYNLKEYYVGISLSNNHRQYIVTNYLGDYLGACSSIEEALQYRDMFYHASFKESPRPTRLDLKKNNLHLKHGLEYPLPERLTPTHKSHYGEGHITKKGGASYHIYHGGKKDGNNYYCACRTYEQAWYVKHELQKCNWDKEKVPEILDNYPVWYTGLMEFYRYINRSKTKTESYGINIPKQYLKPGTSREIINGYSHLEDALFERDFLVEHDWDYNVLVESIDDTENPYYNMELPPYPERKIKNIEPRDYHEKELTEIFHLIYDDGIVNQEEICERVGINSSVTLRNWLKNFWNTTWTEFKRVSLTGENPLNTLEKKEIIYQPDLSKPMPSNFNGWVQKHNSKRSPFMVRKGDVEYGYYPTEKMARKVVKKLIACNWDKSKLPEIKKSVGYEAPPKRDHVYPQGKGWTIRRKNKERKMINYGYYDDKRIADLTRDFLKQNDYNKELYPGFRSLAEYIIRLIDDIIPYTMFNGNSNAVNEYNILDFELIDEDYYYQFEGKYHVSKLVDGEPKYYGEYDSEEEAKEIVEVLQLNNWDESVLTELKGVIF